MSTRATAIVGLVAFIIVTVLLGIATAGRGEAENIPQPPSTYLAGPGGASALAEGLTRLGAKVDRSRRPWRSLAPDADSSLFVVLGPSARISARDAERLVDRSRDVGPVLIAGRRAGTLLACWGWKVVSRGEDSIRVTEPGRPPAADAAWVTDILVPDTREVDSTSTETIAPAAACGPVVGRLDTILVTAGRRPVLLRVTPRFGFPAYLASESDLFTNRVLRQTAGGPFALSLLRGAGAHVVFDEFHHGYGDGGNLAEAVLDWSKRSPWGWSAWQLILVGLVALVAAMVRFGPVRSVIRRTRRSPLEHVRALATALQAARGHDVAVELLVRGLRRRLSRDGHAGREPAAEWLASLAERTRSPRVRAAAGRLRDLTRPRRSVADVLAAANAVEDVWQELRP
jgi:hypothetical protein